MKVKVPLEVMAASNMYREYLTPALIADCLKGYPEDKFPASSKTYLVALRTIHVLTMGRFSKSYPYLQQYYGAWGKYIFHYNGAVHRLVELTKEEFCDVKS